MASKSRLCCLLLAALFVLTACHGGEGEVPTSEPETEAPADPEIVLDLVKDGASGYKIIFPAGGDVKYVTAAESLGTAVKKATGVRLSSGTDFLAPGAEPGAYEILIGAVNRPEAQSVYAELRKGEYAICAVGTKLVICGYDAASTDSAVKRFLSQYLGAAAEGTLSYSSSTDYRKTNTYRLSAVTVDGTPLADFTVVYDPASGSAKYAATAFAAYIASAAGLRLPVSTEKGSAAHVISIGASSSLPAGTYSVTVSGGSVVAAAADDAGLFDAEAVLENEVFTTRSSELALASGASFTGSTAANVTADAARKAGEVRVMYHNVWGYQSEYPILCRAGLALDVYRAYAPDILCFEEAGPMYRGDAGNVTKWLGANGYAEICDTANGGTGNPIWYRTDLFTLLEKGYGKSRNGDKGTTWAVFERKSDGKRFAVTNSHFAANSNANGDVALGDRYRADDAAKAVELAEAIAAKYPGISIVMGGDCNATKSSEAFKKITASGAVNARDLMTDGWKLLSEFHGSFSYDAELGLYDVVTGLTNSGTSAIDHIFLRGGVTLSRYGIVTDYAALTCSDHAPHFADLVLP